MRISHFHGLSSIKLLQEEQWDTENKKTPTNQKPST